ncbi:co-chaperone GroES [Fusobacterium sp. HMSC064B11]|uniref:co-chaperone GroES n=1 Tax=Fusobacterium sp. HMSC064B11 TaxID=1739543 RepID=UPI0008A251EF|nr:co-chaperone GroES [Fusobacterium sp. HMSC064B11]OFO30486.1 co-chaperone GroES [Fusobacterium sp. HMSC064B11]
MNIKPIGERVLLKPIKKEEKTKSGILLSSKSSNTDTKNEAEVVALGKGEKLEGIKVGDKVIFNKFSGNEIEDGNIKYLIVNADDILAVIE